MKKGSKIRSYSSLYRSYFEEQLANELISKKIKFTYEEDKIKYTIPSTTSTYTPDFKITTKSGKEIYIEAKGIWEPKDRYKHLYLRQQHPELDIRFVFSYSKNKITKTSKTTYEDICNGKGWPPFKGHIWKYSNKVIPQEWLEE